MTQPQNVYEKPAKNVYETYTMDQDSQDLKIHDIYSSVRINEYTDHYL